MQGVHFSILPGSSHPPEFYEIGIQGEIADIITHI